MKLKRSQALTRRDRQATRHGSLAVTIRHFNGGIVWRGSAADLLAACPAGRPWYLTPLANAAGTAGGGDPTRVVQYAIRDAVTA